MNSDISKLLTKSAMTAVIVFVLDALTVGISASEWLAGIDYIFVALIALGTAFFFTPILAFAMWTLSQLNQVIRKGHDLLAPGFTAAVGGAGVLSALVNGRPIAAIATLVAVIVFALVYTFVGRRVSAIGIVGLVALCLSPMIPIDVVSVHTGVLAIACGGVWLALSQFEREAPIPVAIAVVLGLAVTATVGQKTNAGFVASQNGSAIRSTLEWYADTAGRAMLLFDPVVEEVVVGATVKPKKVAANAIIIATTEPAEITASCFEHRVTFGPSFANDPADGALRKRLNLITGLHEYDVDATTDVKSTIPESENFVAFHHVSTAPNTWAENVCRELKSRNRLRDTMIVVTSVRGGANKRVLLRSPTAFSEVSMVPLFIVYPRAKSSREYRHGVSHADIAPTILERLGIRSEEIFDGASVHASKERPHTMVKTGTEPYSTTAVFRDGMFLVRWNRTGHLALFDLNEDREARHNIASENPDIVAELHSTLKGLE